MYFLGKETIQVSPQQNVISMATLDIIEDDDGQLHFEPVEDHGIGREDIVMAEQRISEGLLVTNSDVTVSGNEEISLSTGDNEKYSEILQELIGNISSLWLT